MEFKISELMNDYIDHAYSPAEDHETSVERIKAMTMEKINRGQKKPVRKLGRTLLVAAVLAAVLAVAAFAVYQATMADRVLENREIERSDGSSVMRYSPVGTAEEAASGETNIIESGSLYRVSPADSANSEYMALQEWIEYSMNASFGEDEPRLDAENPYRMCYPVIYEAQVEKLKEIAEKYELQLIESYETFSRPENFYAYAGLTEFMPLEGAYEDEDSCSGIVYGDGSFMANALKTNLPDSNESDTVNINVNRAMKGSLTDIYILGDAPEKYTNEAYATESGVLTDLALGEYYSMIFAELDNCYVTIFLNGGTNPTEYLTLLDMDDLKYIADGIDFAVLGR